MSFFNFNQSDPTPTAPAAPTIPVEEAPKPEVSDFDKLQEMLYPPKKDGDESSDSNQPKEPLDPTKMFEDKEAMTKMASGISFTDSLPEDLIQKVQNNEPGAQVAVMNHVGQTAFLKALEFSSHISKQATADAVEHALNQSKGQIDKSLGDYELAKELPELSNPVIKLGLQQVRKQLLEQNPSMPVKEQARQMKVFLKGANDMVNPDPNATPDMSSEEEQAWEDWVNQGN